MSNNLDNKRLTSAFESLDFRLRANGAPPMELVVCGGSALIVLGLVPRTTKDVDVVALMKDGELIDPAPLPEPLVQAAREVAEDLGLPAEWLNNGPSSGEGGLFQLGLPEGFAQRLHPERFGGNLTVYFVDRTDQVHFKLFASADSGSYHIEDLRALSPSSDELLAAARWTMTHDVSEGYEMILKQLLRNLGHDDIADRL